MERYVLHALIDVQNLLILQHMRLNFSSQLAPVRRTCTNTSSSAAADGAANFASHKHLTLSTKWRGGVPKLRAVYRFESKRRSSMRPWIKKMKLVWILRQNVY
jgi:hypothetical protein